MRKQQGEKIMSTNEIFKTLEQMKELVERLEWFQGLFKEYDKDTFLHFCSIWYDHEHKKGKKYEKHATAIRA